MCSLAGTLLFYLKCAPPSLGLLSTSAFLPSPAHFLRPELGSLGDSYTTVDAPSASRTLGEAL